MKRVDIIRHESTPSSGTIGVLKVDGRLVCYTLEPYDKHNKKNESCIPEGTYVCKKDNKGRFRHWRVEDVPNRSNIEFHKGNTIQDSRGCILVGRYLGQYGQQRAVLGSADAMHSMSLELAPDKEFMLYIQNMY